MNGSHFGDERKMRANKCKCVPKTVSGRCLPGSLFSGRRQAAGAANRRQGMACGGSGDLPAPGV